METYAIDDDKAGCIEELIVRALNDPPNLYLSDHFGEPQEPLIVTQGVTIEELLPFKHHLKAVLGGTVGRIVRPIARIRRWDAVWLAMHLIKDERFYNSVKATFAQDIINWGWRNRHAEDNPNRPNLKPRSKP